MLEGEFPYKAGDKVMRECRWCTEEYEDTVEQDHVDNPLFFMIDNFCSDRCAYEKYY